MTTPAHGARWLRRAAVGLAAAGAIAVLVTLGRGAIASTLVARALRQRGLTCEELDVDVGWTLEEAWIDTMRCAGEGPIAEVSLPRGATIALAERRPVSIDAPEVALRLRAAAPEVGALDPEGLFAGEVPGAMAAALDRVAAAADEGAIPRVRIGAVLVHGAGPSLDVHGVEITPEGRRLVVTVASAAPPSAGLGRVAAGVRMMALALRASRDTVELRGTIVAELDLDRHASERAIPFRVVGAGDARHGLSYRLEVDGLERLAALRERLLELRARREAGEVGPRIRLERLRERVHGLRERTDEAREALEDRAP